MHRAKFEDQEIVLKIQYPRVAESIDSDLKILKTLATSFCQLTGRKMDLGPLFAEFKSILVQEVDYEAEAEFQKQYGLNVSKLTPKNGVKYCVPKVYEDISTKKILASSYEPGISLRSWISTNPDMEKREALAYAILDLYFHEFFEWGLVQTDPNWGNFLINEKENELGLVLLDFGATRRYEKEFIKNYIQLLNLAANRDFAKLKKHAIQFKMIDERESEEAFKAFEDVIMTAIKPFFAGHDSNHFDFTDKNHSVESQNATKILSDELVYSPPPYAIIFLHRKLAGVYSILKGLEVKLDISSYWQQMTKLSNIDK